MPVKIIPLPFPPFLNSYLATARASDSNYMLDHAARYTFYVCIYVCKVLQMTRISRSAN